MRIPFVARTSFRAIGMPAIGDCVAPVVGVHVHRLGPLARDLRRRGEDRLHVAVDRLDAPERRLGQLGGGQVARAELLGELGSREVADLAHEPVSAIRGTLNRPPSASGAFASAAA